MARYRSIQTTFWQDNFIVKLPLIEKAFYNYILTNTRTSQCGIYNFSITFTSVELGLDEEEVKSLINKFVAYGKILYDENTEEIMILNWYKYNISNSKNTLICVNRELSEVKNKEFIKKFYELCKNKKYPLDIIFYGIDLDIAMNIGKTEDMIRNMNTVYNTGIVVNGDMAYNTGITVDGVTTTGTDIAASTEEVANKNTYNTWAADITTDKYGTFTADKHIKVGTYEVIKHFSSNIHMIKYIEQQYLMDWCQKLSSEIVIMAINEAVRMGARNINYINGILRNWYEEGLKDAGEVEIYLKNWQDKHNKNTKDTEIMQNASAYRIVAEVEDNEYDNII